MALNHIVARSMTKPWEIKQRKLKYLDLKEQKIKIHSSKTLLAKEGLFDAKTDRLLGSKIENFLSPTRALIKQGKTQIQIQDHRVYNALYLGFWLQLARVKCFRSGNYDRLTELANFNDTELEGLAQLSKNEHILYQLNLPDRLHLFFNNTGIFNIPYIYHDVDVEILAMPITPSATIVSLPKNIYKNSILLKNFNEQTDMNIVRYSVGASSFSEKVIIPPDYQDVTEKDMIESINEWIQLNDDQWKMIMERKQLADFLRNYNLN